MSEEYLTLAIICASALLIGFASKKLRIPSVIGLILIGILIGPYGLKLVKDVELVSVFAEIGGMLLLFLIGTEFSLSKIRKLGLNAIIVAVVELGIVFMVVYEASILLGFSNVAALFIGITFSVTSTALTVKIIQEMGLGSREEVPLLVGVSIIEDVSAVFLLAFISGLAVGKAVEMTDILFSVIKAFLVFSLSFLVLTKILTRFLEKLKTTAPENISLVGFTLAIGLSMVAMWLGLSPAVGAFLAGSIVSSLPHGKEIEESTKHFSLLFISLFFLSIGMLADPRLILQNFNLIGVFVIIAMIGKFVGISLGTFFAGYSGRSSVFSGVAMIPVGEISLLIAKAGVDVGVLPQGFLGVTAMLVLITSLLSYPLLLSHNSIYSFLNRIIPNNLKKTGMVLSKIFLFFRTQLRPKGHMSNIIIKHSRNIFFKLTVISIAIISAIISRSYLPKDFYIILLTSFSVLMIYIIFEYLRGILINLIISSKIFFKRLYRKEIFMRFLYSFSILLFAFFISPLIGNFFGIKYFSIILSTILIIMAVILLVSMSDRFDRLREKILKKRYRYKPK